MNTYILTSDFLMSFTKEFVNDVTSCLKKRESFVFVASDFHRSDQSVYFMHYIYNKFKQHGIHFNNLHLIDQTLSLAQAESFIAAADIVWLAGGRTLHQMQDITEAGIIPALQKRQGLTIGQSAGSINMAKRVILIKNLADDVHRLQVYPGIGLVDVNIEAHLANATPQHYREIIEAAHIAPIYGLYDNSYLVIKDDEPMRIIGAHQIFDETAA